MTKRNRLSTEQKMEILALLARGDTYAQISQHFESTYGFPVADNSIAVIKRNNPIALAKIEEQIAIKTADGTAEILNRGRRMINARLKKAERDENQLDALHRLYRTGELSWTDYEMQKTGMVEVSLDSLVKLTKEMHTQTLEHNPDSASPTDPRALEKLMTAIKSGDTVELQRIIFNGNTPATTA